MNDSTAAVHPTGAPPGPGGAGHEEARWHASLAVVAALGLYIALPSRLVVGPSWALPLLELSILVPLSVAAPRRRPNERRWEQVAAITLIALVNVGNVFSLISLIDVLLHGGKFTGRDVLIASAEIWATNVLVFALWYWELDRGGPDERPKRDGRAPDFLFPQMITTSAARPGWLPSFIDYLYLAFTNATAFSPTDTMPLTPWAKALMLAQASTSLLTITLATARAVNILA